MRLVDIQPGHVYVVRGARRQLVVVEKVVGRLIKARRLIEYDGHYVPNTPTEGFTIRSIVTHLGPLEELLRKDTP